jgi:hypothetical protein
MTQADCVLSTPPINASADPTRRTFLSAAVGGAALAMALPLSASALAAPSADPILEAIEAHKVAYARFMAALEVLNSLEEELPRHKRRSEVKSDREKIIETDDPRRIDCARNVQNAIDLEVDAGVDLVRVRQTTLNGLLVLLSHAVEHDGGEQWPQGELDGDSKTWHQLLVENTAAVLPALVQRPAA